MERVDGYVAELEYVHGCYPEMAPSSLNFALLMQGIEPVPLDRGFSYCDLGCGQGVSSNIFAACHPEGSFHAVDFNNSHIVGARGAADHAKLSNSTFWEAKFADLTELQMPDFDFITLHGVYSWVNRENRQHILDFIAQKLKPGGVVYVSYNCLPGWSAFAPVRELMVAHCDSLPGPLEDKISGSLEFVARLNGLNLSYFASNPAAAGFFEHVRKFPRNYLAHEFYNRNWTLFYHADVVNDLAAANMTFAGSASYADNLDFLRFSAEEQELVKDISDPVMVETVKDFATNQRFRKDIFTRGGEKIPPAPHLQRMGASRLALAVPNGKIERRANFPRGEAKCDPQLYEPVLRALEERPQSPDELLSRREAGAMGNKKLLQVLMVLLAARYIMPAVDPAQAAVSSTKLLNYSILERSVHSADTHYLASPVLLNAIPLDRIQRLLLLCEVTRSGDPHSFLRSILPPIDRESEQLPRQIEEFHEHHLPLLRQLWIA